MTDSSQGDGWWLAPDGKWYPPLDPTVPIDSAVRPKKRRITAVLLTSIVVLLGAAVAAYFVNGQNVPGFGSETAYASFALVDLTDENPLPSTIIIEMTRGPVEIFASQPQLTPIKFDIENSEQAQFTLTDARKEFQPGTTCNLIVEQVTTSAEFQVIVEDDQVSVRNFDGETVALCGRRNPVGEARLAAEIAAEEARLAAEIAAEIAAEEARLAAEIAAVKAERDAFCVRVRNSGETLVGPDGSGLFWYNC
jgi:hypothetical protein